VLWVGFVVLTLVAYLAVLFTGKYPHAIYAYNVGVLRWSWRVNYYGYQALGTDRSPRKASPSRAAICGPATSPTSAACGSPRPVPPARPSSSASPRRSEVNAWLSGIAHDRIVGISTDNAGYNRTAGATRRVAAPAAQDFWLASATGTNNATLDWQVTTGDFTVVLANANGSTGVAADVQAAAQVPGLSALGAALLATGIVFGLLALALIAIGGIGLGRRHSGPPTTAGPPPSTGPPPGVIEPVAPVTTSL
jgi:hypothetical protein